MDSEAKDQADAISVYVWGTNDHGALCLPTLDEVDNPRRLLCLRSQYTRCIGVADNLSLCATGSGVVLQWGGYSGGLPCPLIGAPVGCCFLATNGSRVHVLNDEGHVLSWAVVSPLTSQLGLTVSRLPIPVDVEQLSCGDTHALALVEGGSVYSWGRGIEGQLGRDVDLASAGASDPVGDVDRADADWGGVPRRIDALDELNLRVCSIGCGAVHSALVSTSGKLLLCGLLHKVTVPNATTEPNIATSVTPAHSASATACVRRPIVVDGPWAQSDDLAAIACGRAHTLALSHGGQLFSFGEGDAGQLGHSAAVPQGRPMRVGGPLASRTIARVWAGASFSFARSEPGGGTGCEDEYFYWGKRGDSARGGTRLPTELPELRGLDVVEVRGSSTHCLALTSGGDIYAWGGGAGGALGLQQLGSMPSPQRLTALDRTRICKVACGGGPHTLALEASGGGVFAWGRNGSGELGHGEGDGGCGAPRRLLSGAMSSQPARIVHIAAGGNFSLACGAHATDIFGWGGAAHGVLGGCGGVPVVWTPIFLDVLNAAAAVRYLCLHPAAHESAAALSTQSLPPPDPSRPVCPSHSQSLSLRMTACHCSQVASSLQRALSTQG